MRSDESTLFYPHRTSESVYRIPTPPRIVVPPPTLNANSLPEITLHALKTATFLNTVSYQNIISQNALLEWTYESRRHAQLILPYLFLGPMGAAKDEAFLKKEGITCLLGIRPKDAFQGKLMVAGLQKAQGWGLGTHTVDLGSNQELIQAFPQTTKLIYEHIAARHQTTGQVGKVLVFCESGNERSAGVVAAYLMEMHEDVDFIKAMQLVQAQRFCVNFDDGLKRLLHGYWDILCAKRAVAEGQGQASNGAENGVFANGGGGAVQAPTPTNNKRSLERDEDDMMEGVDEDDVERFGGRTFAPFQDQLL